MSAFALSSVACVPTYTALFEVPYSSRRVSTSFFAAGIGPRVSLLSALFTRSTALAEIAGSPKAKSVCAELRSVPPAGFCDRVSSHGE